MKNQQITVCFLFVILFSVFLYSCTSVSESALEPASIEETKAIVEDRLIPVNVNYDSNENILYHMGWKISAPSQCSFQLPLSGSQSSNILKLVYGDDTLFSLSEIDFSFNVDHDLLLKNVESEILDFSKITEAGNFQMSVSTAGSRQADYWVYDNKTVMLEKKGNRYFEWRLKYPLNNSEPESAVVKRSIKEAIHISPEISGRIRETGFSFIAHNGPWRWKSDLGDGFLLECMVRENEPGIIAAILSIDEVDDEGWFKSVFESYDKKVSADFILNGEDIHSDMSIKTVADSFGRNEHLRLIIHIPSDNLHSDIGIFIYYKIIDGYTPDPMEILNSDQIQHLLKYDITLPVEVL